VDLVDDEISRRPGLEQLRVLPAAQEVKQLIEYEEQPAAEDNGAPEAD
jgi:hypothetical protein